MTEETFLVVEDVTRPPAGLPPPVPPHPPRTGSSPTASSPTASSRPARRARVGAVVAVALYLAAAGSAVVGTQLDAWVLGVGAHSEVTGTVTRSGSFGTTLTVRSDLPAYTLRQTAWGASRVVLAPSATGGPPAASADGAETDPGPAARHLALGYLAGAAGLVLAAVMVLQLWWRSDRGPGAIIAASAGAALFGAVWIGEVLRVLGTRALYLDARGTDPASPTYHFAVGAAVWVGLIATALAFSATAVVASAVRATATAPASAPAAGATNEDGDP